MKKTLLTFLLLLFSVTLFSGETIELSVGEWPPFITKNSKTYGFAGEVVIAAFKEVGIDVKLKFYPWKRSRFMVVQGSSLGSFPWTELDDRKNFAYFSAPIFVSKQVLFYRTDNIEALKYDKLVELKKYKVGGVRKYWYEKLYTETGLNVDWGHDPETNMKKLFHKRIDLYCEDEVVGWGILKKFYPKDYRKFATDTKPLKQAAQRIMFSKKHPKAKDMLDKFNKGLKSLKEKGTYKKIAEKNGVLVD